MSKHTGIQKLRDGGYQIAYVGPHKCRLGTFTRRGKTHEKCPTPCPKTGGPELRRERYKTEAEARRVLNERRHAVDTGAPLPVARELSFEDLVALATAKYRAKGNRSTRLLGSRFKRLRALFGHSPVKDITADRVTAYEAARLAAGAARATVNNELAALRFALRLAVDAGRLARAPKISTPDPHNARTGFFEPEDVAALMVELPAALRPVIEFAHVTGWRVQSEILPLTWDCVHFDAGTVRLEPGTTKNRAGRTFPFDAHPRLAALLAAQRKQVSAASPWVFPSPLGRRQDPHLFYAAWRAACKRADLVGMIPHDFRRTAVRNLVRKGVPERVAMQLTGHKTRAIFDRYDIVNEADLRAGVAKLAAESPLVLDSNAPHRS